MNEKKIRREIRIYKVVSVCCAIAGVCFVVAAFYFQKLSLGNKTLEYWKLQAFITSYFAFGVALAMLLCTGLCVVLQRQAEYTLFLKEALTSRKEQPIADPWR